jgi:hypothetical protein
MSDNPNKKKTSCCEILFIIIGISILIGTINFIIGRLI